MALLKERTIDWVAEPLLFIVSFLMVLSPKNWMTPPALTVISFPGLTAAVTCAESVPWVTMSPLVGSAASGMRPPLP